MYSAKYCFVEKMAKDGIMPAPSVAVLNEWFQWFTENVQIPVDCIGRNICEKYCKLLIHNIFC